MFKFLQRFRKPKPQVCEGEIPCHIQAVARLYPVLETLVGNKAKGEVKRFELTDNKLRVGQALFKKNNTEIWIHLGNDYFKNTVTL